MTVIVLDPSTLHDVLPNASPANPVRVRLIVQTVRFDYSETTLEVASINRELLKDTVILHLTGVAFTSNVARKGTLLSVYAAYTGAEIQVFECMVEDETVLMLLENRQLIQRMCALESI